MLGFNLIVTAWIGELGLLALGVTFHLILVCGLVYLASRRSTSDALSVRV